MNGNKLMKCTWCNKKITGEYKESIDAGGEVHQFHPKCYKEMRMFMTTRSGVG